MGKIPEGGRTTGQMYFLDNDALGYGGRFVPNPLK
jgi:hypothetical protein